MDVKYVEMTGYHGTISKYADSIAKYGLDPDKTHKRPDHWLGQGVYLFEDFDLARWWADTMAGKLYNAGNFPIVYQTQIRTSKEKILNLDNHKEYNRFIDRILKMQNEIESNDEGKVPIFDREKQRAVYFDYYKAKYQISVIIYTFSKECATYGTFSKGSDLARQIELQRALGLAYHEKQICVSKKECIKNIEVLYNGEDEVI